MKKLTDLLKSAGLGEPAELKAPSFFKRIEAGEKIRLNVFALGDVGTNVLIGLRLLGGDVISEIGIYDISEAQVERIYMEVSQIYSGVREMPPVKKIGADELFDCDALVFCASAGIPEAKEGVDVRMAQLESNGRIIASLVDKLNCGKPDGKDCENPNGVRGKFQGMVFLVSDPVDPLCSEFLRLSNLSPSQIRGFGLGVMYARGRFYANSDSKFNRFLTQGRAFGPHGKDLILADSLEDYDDEISRELTELAVNANMKVRELGFKPFIAPAFSSGALSIVSFLKGEWSYGSFYLGDENKGAFMGALSRVVDGRVEWEDADLDEKLFMRIQAAYLNLLELEEKRRG